jgi:hypothetical protein
MEPSMTTKPNDFLTMLRSLTDDQFSSALALDPELIKKAQKALQDAKQKKIEIDKQKSLELAASTGRPFDLKSWMRAKKLITGPHNETNSLDFQNTIAKTDPNITPEGEVSLMKISMDYLAERDRVMLEWPLAVFKSGANFGYDEVESLVKLFSRRGGIPDLGEASRGLFSSVFCLAQPWKEHEAKLMANKTIPGPLVEFLQKIAFGGNNYSNSKPKTEPRNWEALENLARAGCLSFSTKVDTSSYRSTLAWEQLVGEHTEGVLPAEAKVSAFSAMIDLGWCDSGVTPTTDNLSVHGSKSNSVINCASRSVLAHMPLDGSGLEIFNLLCEREAGKGFERYDALGRSRLYFANERLRQLRGSDIGKEQKVILAVAQRCLELGDPPESVNSQNPLAKAADSHFSHILTAAIERRELGAVAGAGSARPKARSL